MKTRLLLVDDHSVVLEGLLALIDSEEDLEVLGQTCNGTEALLMVKDLRPDVVLLDLIMPEMNGIRVIHELVAQTPSTRVLVLSCCSHADDVKKAMNAGATGYVTKQTAGDDLIRAIQEVRRGKRFVSASVGKFDKVSSLALQGLTMVA